MWCCPALKLLISFMTAVSLGLTCAVLGGDSYSALAARGYRWVTINGPYACITEQEAKRISAHHTDAIELQVVENIECYYLIPGTIVQVIKEEPAHGISEIRLGSITRSLWTYSRFLSKRPVKDTYGVIETPESSGLIPAADTAIVPALPSDNSTARSRPNENP
jgi:hypothetical protein